MSRNRPVANSCSLAAICCAALVVAAVVAWGPQDASALQQPARKSMVLFGSSSMKGIFGIVMAKDFEQLGFDVTRQGIVSAGLARPDFRDVPQILGTMPIAKRSTSVVLYIGGNDAQSLWLRPEERTARDRRPWVSWRDERWQAIYEARMVKLINSLCERGAQHTFVLPPADVKRESLQVRLERVRTVQQRAVRASKCGRYISTMGDRGRFELHGKSLRARDGVHMNRTGAELVWGRIRNEVFSVLGYRLPVEEGVPINPRNKAPQLRRVKRERTRDAKPVEHARGSTKRPARSSGKSERKRSGGEPPAPITGSSDGKRSGGESPELIAETSAHKRSVGEPAALITGRSDGKRSGGEPAALITGASDGKRSGGEPAALITGASDGRRSGGEPAALITGRSDGKRSGGEPAALATDTPERKRSVTELPLLFIGTETSDRERSVAELPH